MPKKSFTKKEMIVFYGMTKYPGLNDNSLSKKIDINPSTIATIRNKFKKNDYFSTVRIPMLQHCGFELFTVTYDRLYFSALSESPNDIINHIFKRIPNNFFLLVAPDSWLSMGYYQNYLNLKRVNEIIRINKYQFNFQEDTETQIIFPFGLTKIFNYFDYSRIIHNYFDLELEDSIDNGQDDTVDSNLIHADFIEKLDAEDRFGSLDMNDKQFENIPYHSQVLSPPPAIKLTRAEREVFLALMQYPELSDFAINKMISISATSVNNIRKKFEKKSIIKQCIIPNLRLLGFELITLTHIKFKSPGNLINRVGMIKNFLPSIPSILYLSSNTDEIIMAVYKDFAQYQHINDELTKIYRDKNILASEPRTLLFPLSESVIIKEHSYVPIINQLLGKGKSIINSILEIIGHKLGDTGKQILTKHLESIEVSPDELTVKDIPKLIEIAHEIFTPIFGVHSADEIAKNLKELEKSSKI